MKLIGSIVGNCKDVDGVIMCADSEEVSIWRVLHHFAPFSGSLQGGDLLGEIVVTKDSNVSLIVAHSDVAVVLAIRDGSSLLMGG